MKILSGIDIVSNRRISSLIRKSPRVLSDIFSREEIRYCRKKRYPEQSFAARFAAKEAVLKAIGSDILKYELNKIDVTVSPSGKPSVRVKSKALKKEIARLLGTGSFTINVSLSHEQDISVAQAIIYPND